LNFGFRISDFDYHPSPPKSIQKLSKLEGKTSSRSFEEFDIRHKSTVVGSTEEFRISKE